MPTVRLIGLTAYLYPYLRCCRVVNGDGGCAEVEVRLLAPKLQCVPRAMALKYNAD